MKRLRSKPVTRTTDSRQNKKAIDDVFKFHNPHYLMIVGSPDILPHQDLTNPTHYRGDDIPSDDDDYAWQDRRRRHASATDSSGKLMTIGSLTDSPLSVKNEVPNTADRSLSVALLYSPPVASLVITITYR